MPDIKIMGAEIQDGTLWHAYQLAMQFYADYWPTRKLGIYNAVIWEIKGQLYYVYKTKTQLVVRIFREDENLV